MDLGDEDEEDEKVCTCGFCFLYRCNVCIK